MGAKEKKGDVVMMPLDERLVVLLERIANQLDSVHALLRNHTAGSSLTVGPHQSQEMHSSQGKSDNNANSPEIRSGRDEIPTFGGDIVSGFGEDVE